MIYVGIDIAKLNHFASAISSDGRELMMQGSYRFVSFYDLDLMDPSSWDVFVRRPLSSGHA